MRRLDSALALVFAGAMTLGTFAQRAGPSAPPRVANGWLVAADLHVHAYPGDGFLTPQQIRREAARRNLHVVALTNHNQTWNRFLIPRDGTRQLPLLLPGQEVTTSTDHVVAVGVREKVPWRDGSDAVVRHIVARGAIAILAHPDTLATSEIQPATTALLHGVEVANGPAPHARTSPGVHWRAKYAPHVAAIGSSDFHHVAPLGVQRTILRVEQLDERGVREAILQRRSAVRFEDVWVGDSAVIRAAEPHRSVLFDDTPRFGSRAGLLACVLAWLAMFGLVLRARL
jgi:hypothetical protein